MTVGIVSAYRLCEHTSVAMRLADWFVRRGLHVTVRPPRKPARLLGYAADATVQFKGGFADWVGACSLVVWVCMPELSQVQWLRRRRVPSVVYVTGETFTVERVPVLRAAAAVLCSSQKLAEYLRQHAGVRAAVYLPWDSGLPFVRRQWSQTPPLLLLPWHGHEARRFGGGAVGFAEAVLAASPDAKLTIAYNASTLTGAAVRRLRQVQRQFGRNRVALTRGLPPSQRWRMYLAADLVLWPCLSAGVGETAIAAMSVGAPVAAFALPPLTEFLTPANSVLSPLSLVAAADGQLTATPPYARLRECVSAVLDDPGRLFRLQLGALAGLAERRSQFDSELLRLLEIDGAAVSR